MSFLGYASRRVEEAKIPDNLGSDVTMVQKKRLALLAKMGLGPGASRGDDRSPPRPVLRGAGMAVSDPAVAGGALAPPQHLDRKTALLERERRLREQEEKERELEEKAEQERRAKRRGSALQSLGPVQKRDEEIAIVFPAPSLLPAPRQMELKISTDTAERARASNAVPEADDDEDDSDPDEPEVVKCACGATIMKAAKFCHECGAKNLEASASKPPQWKRPQQEQAESKKKAKRKKKRRRDEDDEENAGEEDDDEIEEGSEEAVLRMIREMRNAKEAPAGPTSSPLISIAEKTRAQARVSGAIYKGMVVDSVKGKVSHAYKGFTDADLERRFTLPQSAASGASLMSEEQVLQMINKEKKGVGNKVAAQRRIQREIAEWTEKKEEHKARESQKNRERLVVSARK